MEKKAKNIRAYHKKCIGCKKFKADIMISVQVGVATNFEIHDFFITNKQAKDLIVEIQKEVSYNESNSEE